MHWTEEFFDDYYLESIDKLTDSEQTTREVNFILEKSGVTKKSQILDLACGEGRHAIEIAKRGFQNIEGIDLTPTYLESAKQNASNLEYPPKFIEADMKDFAREDRYDLIFSLFSSMFYFSDTHNLDILSRLFTGLKRDGCLIVDYFNPISFLKTMKRKDWYVTGDDSIILEKFSHNPISGIITNERLIVTKDGKRVKRVYHVRDYSVSELRFHFERIGFEVLDVFGSFEGEKYTVDSPRQIYILKKTE